VPAVFLTAKVQPADIARLRELGAAGVIAKPFDPMGLPGELEALLPDAA
jgi:CheY-like chemotaxis protein